MKRRTLASVGSITVFLAAAWAWGQAGVPNTKSDPSIRDDLSKVQGTWVRTQRTGIFSSQRIIKEIKGTKETVTTYDSEGKVLSAHMVDVELRRAGPVRIFRYVNQVFVDGPNKGQTNPGGGAYIYKVSGDTFFEVLGLLVGQESGGVRVMQWKRQKAEK